PALAVGQDARGHELQDHRSTVVDHAVTRVGATLVAHHPVVLAGQEIDDLPLALVPPLRADDDGGGHAQATRPGACPVARKSRTALAASTPARCCASGLLAATCAGAVPVARR